MKERVRAKSDLKSASHLVNLNLDGAIFGDRGDPRELKFVIGLFPRQKIDSAEDINTHLIKIYCEIQGRVISTMA